MSLASRSAPLARRASTTAKWPIMEAAMRAVLPYLMQKYKEGHEREGREIEETRRGDLIPSL